MGGRSRVTPDASKAVIGKMVQEALTPRSPQESPTQSQSPAPSSNSQGDGPVPDITSFGKNSPIGESSSQPSNPNGSAVAHDDVQRLTAALAELRQVERSISKPAVKRALEHDPENVRELLAEFDTTLNKIGRAVSVRRTD